MAIATTGAKQGLCKLTTVDVPWDGVQEDRVTCCLCSSACYVALRERLLVWMSSLELVTDYSVENMGSIQGRGGRFRHLEESSRCQRPLAWPSSSVFWVQWEKELVWFVAFRQQ